MNKLFLLQNPICNSSNVIELNARVNFVVDELYYNKLTELLWPIVSVSCFNTTIHRRGENIAKAIHHNSRITNAAHFLFGSLGILMDWVMARYLSTDIAVIVNTLADTATPMKTIFHAISYTHSDTIFVFKIRYII